MDAGYKGIKGTARLFITRMGLASILKRKREESGVNFEGEKEEEPHFPSYCANSYSRLKQRFLYISHLSSSYPK